MFVLSGHTEPVRSVAFTHDGAAVWTGGEDGTLVLWDRFSGQSLRRLSLSELLHGRAIEQLVPLPAGSVLVRGGDAGFRIDTPENGRTRVQALPLGSGRRVIALSPDGQLMAILAPDDTLEVRAAKTGRVRSIHSVEGLHRPGWAAFSPDGNWLAVGDADGRVELFPSADSGPPAAGWENPRAILTGGVFSPDSRRLVLAAGRAVIACDMPGKNERILAACNSDAVFFHCAAFSPDGARLAVGRWDGQVLLFDAATGKPQSCNRFHTGTVLSVAFAPDGLTAASGGDDYLARVWDVNA